MTEAFVFIGALGGMFVAGVWWERDGKWKQRWHCPGCGITVRSNQRATIDKLKADHADHA